MKIEYIDFKDIDVDADVDDGVDDGVEEQY